MDIAFPAGGRTIRVRHVCDVLNLKMNLNLKMKLYTLPLMHCEFKKSVLAAQFFELFGLARLYLELLSQVSRHTTELALTIYHKSIHNSRLPWHVHRDWSQPEAAVQGVGRVCNLWDLQTGTDLE